MQKLYFRQCTATLLDRTFGLRQTFVSDILDDWLNAEQTVSEAEKATLTTYQELLVLNETIWNEQELALLCIGPIFATVHLTEPYRYNLFAGRRISAPLSTDSSAVRSDAACTTPRLATLRFLPSRSRLSWRRNRRR